MTRIFRPTVFAIAVLSATFLSIANAGEDSLKPTEDDKKWLISTPPPFPADNEPTAARIELGKQLFFDPRLSGDGNMSCATCHNPMQGWSDGLPTGRGSKSMKLGRATPTVINTAYNFIQMWDGRKKNLEDQAMGPIESANEMNMNVEAMFEFLNQNEEYKAAFANAYPDQAIDYKTFGKAIASYERTLVSNNSPFDRWLKGDEKAMTEQQIRGFRLFSDQSKSNCTACHQAPNFTDNGFHNVGLASYADAEPDMGRFKIKPIKSLRGAFKTPTLRDIALTAPYFHDGSAKSLMDVMRHYAKGGEVKDDLSPDIKALDLSEQEMEDIVAFMKALTTTKTPVVLPNLPL